MGRDSMALEMSAGRGGTRAQWRIYCDRWPLHKGGEEKFLVMSVSSQPPADVGRNDCSTETEICLQTSHIRGHVDFILKSPPDPTDTVNAAGVCPAGSYPKTLKWSPHEPIGTQNQGG
jgi:hypothetical protein